MRYRYGLKRRIDKEIVPMTLKQAREALKLRDQKYVPGEIYRRPLKGNLEYGTWSRCDNVVEF